jgi:hypothetical protein
MAGQRLQTRSAAHPVPVRQRSVPGSPRTGALPSWCATLELTHARRSVAGRALSVIFQFILVAVRCNTGGALYHEVVHHVKRVNSSNQLHPQGWL